MRGNLEWRAKFGTTEYIYWNAYEHDAGLRLEMELAAWIVRFKLIRRTKSRHFDHVDENTMPFAVSDNTVLISAFCLASWLFIFFLFLFYFICFTSAFFYLFSLLILPYWPWEGEHWILVRTADSSISWLLLSKYLAAFSGRFHFIRMLHFLALKNICGKKKARERECGF